MSFSVVCERYRLEYSAVRLWTQPRALVHPGFAAAAARDRALPAHRARSPSRSATRQHARRLRAHRGLLPLLPRPLPRAVRRRRSGPPRPRRPSPSPAPYAVRFFQNHGLLGFRRHIWRTVAGGSRALRRRHHRAARRAASPARRGAGGHPRRRRRGACAPPTTAPTASTPSSSPPTRPQALAMLRRRRRPRAGGARRLPHHAQQHGAPHRPLLLPPPAPRLGRLELPGGRLPRALAPAHRELPPQYAPGPRRAGAVLRDAEPRRAIAEDRVIRRSTTPTRSTASRRWPRRSACRARRPPAHLVLRRLPRLRVPRGRPRLGRCAAAARAGSALVRSALYEGTLLHVRTAPARNVFRYPVCFYALDLDELPELDRRLRLFGYNRRNVVTFRDADHLGLADRPVKENVLALPRRERHRPGGRARRAAHQPAPAGLRLQPGQLLLLLRAPTARWPRSWPRSATRSASATPTC